MSERQWSWLRNQETPLLLKIEEDCIETLDRLSNQQLSIVLRAFCRLLAKRGKLSQRIQSVYLKRMKTLSRAILPISYFHFSHVDTDKSNLVYHFETAALAMGVPSFSIRQTFLFLRGVWTKGNFESKLLHPALAALQAHMSADARSVGWWVELVKHTGHFRPLNHHAATCEQRELISVLRTALETAAGKLQPHLDGMGSDDVLSLFTAFTQANLPLKCPHFYRDLLAATKRHTSQITKEQFCDFLLSLVQSRQLALAESQMPLVRTLHAACDLSTFFSPREYIALVWCCLVLRQ